MASLLSYALTNVADVKESLGISSGDTSKDNLITRNINKSTRAIESYCSRRFKETTYTQEEYNPTHIDELVLKQRPITATQAFSLEVRNTGINADNWETIDSQLYFVDTSSAVVYCLFRMNGRWKRFRATYSAGYVTIPEDLAEACVNLACYYTNYPDGRNIGVQELREGQRQIRYLNTTQTFRTLLENLGVDQIVDSYSNNPLMPDR